MPRRVKLTLVAPKIQGKKHGIVLIHSKFFRGEVGKTAVPSFNSVRQAKVGYEEIPCFVQAVVDLYAKKHSIIPDASSEKACNLFLIVSRIDSRSYRKSKKCRGGGLIRPSFLERRFKAICTAM